MTTPLLDKTFFFLHGYKKEVTAHTAAMFPVNHCMMLKHRGSVLSCRITNHHECMCSHLVFVEGSGHSVPQRAQSALHLCALLCPLHSLLLFFIPKVSREQDKWQILEYVGGRLKNSSYIQSTILLKENSGLQIKYKRR